MASGILIMSPIRLRFLSSKLAFGCISCGTRLSTGKRSETMVKKIDCPSKCSMLNG